MAKPVAASPVAASTRPSSSSGWCWNILLIIICTFAVSVQFWIGSQFDVQQQHATQAVLKSHADHHHHQHSQRAVHQLQQQQQGADGGGQNNGNLNTVIHHYLQDFVQSKKKMTKPRPHVHLQRAHAKPAPPPLTSHKKDHPPAQGAVPPAPALPVNSNSNIHANNITIYCMLPYVWTPASMAQRIQILQTWGRQCTRLRFLIDPMVQTEKGDHEDARTYPPGTLPDDVQIITGMTRAWHNCTNPKNGKKASECRNIWEKIWRSIVWVNEHEDTSLYDFYIKCDWDTFVFMDHLRQYIAQRQWHGPTQHVYAGHLDLHKPGKPFISGALQLFSSHTWQGLAEVFRKMPKATVHNMTAFTGETDCRDGAGLADYPTALCIEKELGVPSTHTRDEQDRERVLLFPPEDILTFNRTEQGEWWYWGGKPQSVGQLEDCCAHLPLAFHARIYKDVRAKHYYRMEHDLFGTQWPSSTLDPTKVFKHKRQELLDRYFAKIVAARREKHMTTPQPQQQQQQQAKIAR